MPIVGRAPVRWLSSACLQAETRLLRFRQLLCRWHTAWCGASRLSHPSRIVAIRRWIPGSTGTRPRDLESVCSPRGQATTKSRRGRTGPRKSHQTHIRILRVVPPLAQRGGADTAASNVPQVASSPHSPSHGSVHAHSKIRPPLRDYREWQRPGADLGRARTQASRERRRRRSRLDAVVFHGAYETPAADDQQARSVRLSLLGKVAVSAHRFDQPLAPGWTTSSSTAATRTRLHRALESMDGSGEALAAPLSRMQERQDLRFGAARRVDFVQAERLTSERGDACLRA
jgi:hypothetical protein